LIGIRAFYQGIDRNTATGLLKGLWNGDKGYLEAFR